MTDLTAAISQGRPEVARELLNARQYPELHDPDVATKVFKLAVAREYPEIARQIVYTCGNVLHMSVIDAATEKDYPELVRNLIDAGVKPSSRTLEYAIEMFHPDLARKIVLARRNKICSEDTVFSARALELAAGIYSADFLRFLVEKGCPISPRALELVIENGHCDIALLTLAKKQGLVGRAVKPTERALELALQRMNVTLIRELLNAGCSYSATVGEFMNQHHDNPTDCEIAGLLCEHVNLSISGMLAAK